MTQGVAMLFSRFFLLFFCICFPLQVQATTAEFSFAEFNLAFILGLSLPILLIIGVLKPNPSIKMRFPVLLTAILLALLYSVIYISVDNTHVILTLCALLLTTNLFWQRQHNSPNLLLKLNWQVLTTFIFLIIFIFLLWSGKIAPAHVWLMFGGLLFSYSLVILMQSRKQEYREIWHRSIALLLITALFIIGVYYWLVEALAVDFLVIMSVITYVAVMTNGCWHVIKVLLLTGQQEQLLESSRQETQNLSYDPVTNLPIYHQALVSLERALLTNKTSRYAAIVFKPTNFQQVNSILGHKNSDMLLLQLAYCLQKSVADDEELLSFTPAKAHTLRPMRVARLQGLHFLVVMDVAQNKYDDAIIIEQLCNKLSSAVPGPMSFKSFSLYFKLAYGVAYAGQDSTNASEVIACAEDALLVGHGNQQTLSFFKADYAVFNQRQLQKMEQLKQDIKNELIPWLLQPQVRVANKSLVGFEIQAAWTFDKNESLSQQQITSLAEQSGDLYSLTRLMINQAFSVIAQLHKLSFLDTVTIKLSSITLLESELVEFIEQQTVIHGIGCEYLVVEIEEKMLFSASVQAKAIVDQLKSLGVKIAIGNFSGSYEALRYLRRLAINQITIDCQLLANSTAGSSDKAIIDALINVTRKMELPLIGVGVNTVATQEMFVAMGGELVQGKLYNAGVTVDNLAEWLRVWSLQY